MPFSGIEIPGFDPAQPVGRRFSGYRWRVPAPDEPQTGRGFYLASRDVHGSPACDARGSSFDLRLEWANDILREQGYRRLAKTSGYYTDEHGENDTMKPIVARLNHSRGYLPGWTLGEGMASMLAYSMIYDTAEAAALAAHALAEYDAARECEYQERERARLAAEDQAAESRALEDALDIVRAELDDSDDEAHGALDMIESRIRSCSTNRGL